MRLPSLSLLFSPSLHQSSGCVFFCDVTVGEIWCAEEVGDHHGQKTELKCDFDSSMKKWTFG